MKYNIIGRTAKEAYQEICSLLPEGEKHRHYYKGKIDVLMDMLRGSYEERGVKVWR